MHKIVVILTIVLYVSELLRDKILNILITKKEMIIMWHNRGIS